MDVGIVATKVGEIGYITNTKNVRYTHGWVTGRSCGFHPWTASTR